jgi:hypothetical protein
LLEHRVQLPPADTQVAPIEDRKSERVLEKTSQRCFMIVAVGADDAPGYFDRGKIALPDGAAADAASVDIVIVDGTAVCAAP